MRQGKAVTHFAERRVETAVFEMSRCGMSLRQVARFLTEIGVPTKNRGKKWRPQMVNRILNQKNISIEPKSQLEHLDKDLSIPNL